MKARAATVKIVYKGKDISQNIAPCLVAFTFTDNSDGTLDDISFSLEDRGQTWLTSWTPSKGDKIQCSIMVQDGNAQTLPCGEYEVDQIDYSAPPHVLTVKAVSAAITHKLKDEKHSKAWESTGLQSVAGDIANDNGLSLHFDAQDVQFERLEQVRQSDIDFLSEVCANYGLEVKVNEGKLIVYDGEKNESKESVAELTRTDSKLISWKFSTKSTKTYKKARLKYHHAAKKKDIEAEAEDDSVEGTERVLELNQQVDDEGAAKKLAEKKLYEANRGETSGSILLMGDLRFRAGVNVTLSDFGLFDGKYTIKKVVHSLGNGYTTSLELGQGKSSKKAAKQNKKSRQSRKKSGTGGASQYYTGERYYGNAN